MSDHDNHDKHDKKGGHEGDGGHGGGGHGGGGHGGGHEEAHEGAPEWLISFADNVALLMGFFVILLAMNMKQPTTGGIGGKDKNGTPQVSAIEADLIIGIREAFNNPINMSSTDPNDAPLIKRIIQRKEGESKVDGQPGDKKNVESVRPTDYHRIGGKVSFEEGESRLDAAGETALAELAKDLRGRKMIIEVRGHTSLTESATPGDRGMKLSFERAMTVAGLLRAGGLDWDQLRIVAVGPGDRATPIARTDAEQRNNQRVEVIITDESLPDDPYAMDPSGAPSNSPATADVPVGKD